MGPIQIGRLRRQGPISADQQPAALVRKDIQRDDRERIGVQRYDHGDRKIDPERQGKKRSDGELHRIAARYQPGSEARRHAPRHRAPVQVPQVRMMQQRAEAREVPVLPD